MDDRLKIALRFIALVILGSVLGFGPTSLSTFEKGKKLQLAFAAEDYSSATEFLIDLAEENPWWTALWETAGETAYLAGDLEVARGSLEEAHRLDSLTLDGRIRLGEVYGLLGDGEKAAQTWEELEGSADALEKLARLHEEKGEIAKAIAVWNDYMALKDGDVDPELIYHLGTLITAESPPKALPYFDQTKGDFPSAERLAEAIREGISEEPAYQYLSAGQALAAIGEWNLAGYAFKNATILREDYQEAWIYWGEALQQIEDPGEDPLEVLETGLALEPEAPLANLFMGIYWQRDGSHPTALEYFGHVEKSWPENPQVLVESGKSLAALTELEEAMEKFQGAINLAPLDPVYYLELADFSLSYAYQVKEAALPAVRVAVQLAPDDPRGLDLAGQVMAALDDHLNALNFYQRALESDPGYAPTHFHLGIYYSTVEERDPAIYHLQQALSNTTNPALVDQVERLLSSLR